MSLVSKYCKRQKHSRDICRQHVYDFDFSHLRALAQYIRFVSDQVFLRNFRQLISDSSVAELKFRNSTEIQLKKYFFGSNDTFVMHPYIIGHYNSGDYPSTIIVHFQVF